MFKKSYSPLIVKAITILSHQCSFLSTFVSFAVDSNDARLSASSESNELAQSRMAKGSKKDGFLRGQTYFAVGTPTPSRSSNSKEKVAKSNPRGKKG